MRTTDLPDDLSQLPARISRTLDLNLLTLNLATNLERFDAYAYFAREGRPGTRADYSVTCVDLGRDRFDIAALEARADRTLRAKRFRTGYYLNHVFGDPAYLVTQGTASYVFGRRLERTVWPYFVKRILTQFAADRGYLHLKAAGLVNAAGEATLLVGPNGGGKTVFLAQACGQGARFLANTHVLVRDGIAYGIPSAVRVRADAAFADLIEQGKVVPHIESGDYVADPALVFPGGTTTEGTVRNIVITDFDPGRRQGLVPLAPERAELFLDQFSAAVTMYGLKDDMLAHSRGDLDAFTDQLAKWRGQLAALVRGANCYRANVDMLDASARDAALAELGVGRP